NAETAEYAESIDQGTSADSALIVQPPQKKEPVMPAHPRLFVHALPHVECRQNVEHRQTGDPAGMIERQAVRDTAAAPCSRTSGGPAPPVRTTSSASRVATRCAENPSSMTFAVQTNRCSGSGADARGFPQHGLLVE